MTVLDNDDFLKKYGIEFPSPSSLAVLHAEPASRVPNGGYTFSEDALQIIGELVVSSGFSGAQFNHWIASGDDPANYLILFFLDTSYHMAHHIWGIRETKDEIAMTSYLGPNAQKNVAEDPPPVGLLYVADVPTLTDLAERSPFLGQLLPVADGPTDDAIWAYFLGKAEQQEIEDGEVAKAPREKSIMQLVGTGLTGDQT